MRLEIVIEAATGMPRHGAPAARRDEIRFFVIVG
jgi:hypothetical protein